MERLKMAVAYGADAVYLAGTDFGMRSFAGNFTPQELPQAVAYAHSHGVKVHVTVNTMPRNEEIAQLPPYLEQLQQEVTSLYRLDQISTTREKVPLLVWGLGLEESMNLGERKTFADVSATVLEALGIEEKLDGESFYGDIVLDEE